MTKAFGMTLLYQAGRPKVRPTLGTLRCVLDIALTLRDALAQHRRRSFITVVTTNLRLKVTEDQPHSTTVLVCFDQILTTG